jgi:hypothetical protein
MSSQSLQLPNRGAMGPAFDLAIPPAPATAQPSPSGKDQYLDSRHPTLEPMLFHPSQLPGLPAALQQAQSQPISLADFVQQTQGDGWKNKYVLTTTAAADGFVTSELHQLAGPTQFNVGDTTTYPSVTCPTVPGSYWKAVTPNGTDFAATKPYESTAFGGPEDIVTWNGQTSISLVDPTLAENLERQTGKGIVNDVVDPLPVSESPYRYVGLSERLHHAVGDVQSLVGNVTAIPGAISTVDDIVQGRES